MGFIDDICKTVPRMENKCCGVILFILNILISGSGTIIGAIMNNCIGLQIIIGIFQFLLFPIIIGWIWSIIWGFQIFEKSGNESATIYQSKIVTEREVIHK